MTDGTPRHPDPAAAPTRDHTAADASAAPTPILELDRLTKRYQKLTALHDATARIEPRRIVALVGPNGAGKTTAMRCISGIHRPSAGTARICGFDIRTQPIEAKKRLAYVPDDPRLFENLTVFEHLRFVAAAYELRNWEPHADTLLERFELTPKRNTIAADLSRGMRQKTAICASLLHRPRLLILDEPLTGLDPMGIRTIKAVIREHAADGGAVLLSSHLLALVEDLCDWLMVVHKGVVRFTGTMEEARGSFAAAVADANLEEIFMRATADTAPPTAAPPTAPVPPPEPGR